MSRGPTGIVVAAIALTVFLAACLADDANENHGDSGRRNERSGTMDEISERNAPEGWTNFFAGYRQALDRALGAAASDDAPILESSRDPEALLDASLRLAASADSTEVNRLGELLRNADYLGRLDPLLGEYGSYVNQRLCAVLRTAAGNSRFDRDGFAALAQDSVFQADSYRQQLLIRTFAELSHPDQMVISYWERFALPPGPLVYDVIEALMISQDDAAIDLLERLFLSKSQAAGDKLSWFRQLLFPRRYDAPLLQLAQRLLDRLTDPELSTGLLEALFDDRSEDWFGPETHISPASLESATTPARAILERIGRKALAEHSPEARLKLAIEDVLKRL